MTTSAAYFDYADALRFLKAGQRVARSGWNGKGMFLYLVKGSLDGAKLGFAPGEQPAPDHPSTMDGIRFGLFECNADGDTITRLPCIAMRTATGSHLHGWLASQTDMLAEDWQIVPEEAV